MIINYQFASDNFIEIMPFHCYNPLYDGRIFSLRRNDQSVFSDVKMCHKKIVLCLTWSQGCSLSRLYHVVFAIQEAIERRMEAERRRKRLEQIRDNEESDSQEEEETPVVKQVCEIVTSSHQV